jgi:hypothetical protein
MSILYDLQLQISVSNFYYVAFEFLLMNSISHPTKRIAKILLTPVIASERRMSKKSCRNATMAKKEAMAVTACETAQDFRVEKKAARGETKK